MKPQLTVTSTNFAQKVYVRISCVNQMQRFVMMRPPTRSAWKMDLATVMLLAVAQVLIVALEHATR